MIDVDQLQRAVDDTPGDAIAVTKEQLTTMLSEIRAGQAARRSLVNLQSMITVSAATSAMRVPHGYKGPRPVPTP